MAKFIAPYGKPLNIAAFAYSFRTHPPIACSDVAALLPRLMALKGTVP